MRTEVLRDLLSEMSVRENQEANTWMRVGEPLVGMHV